MSCFDIGAQRAANMLASEDIRGLDHLAVQQQLLATATNLIKVAGSSSMTICLPLLSVLLQLKTNADKTVYASGFSFYRFPILPKRLLRMGF